MAFLLFLCLLSTLLPLGQAGWPHVYSGEHFSDLMGSLSDPTIAARSGVLVLYQPKCAHQLRFKSLEMDQHLMYFTHDYVKARQHIWYEYRKEDDLYKKYLQPQHPEAATCFSALYFKQGESLEKPTEVWSMEKDLKTWVWGLLQHKITITNLLRKEFVVIHKPVANGPILSREFIKPGQVVNIKTFLSYTLKIFDEDFAKVIYVTVVKLNLRSIRLGNHQLVEEGPLRAAEDELFNFWYSWIWSHADRHLRNIKQPLIVHNLTQTGYRKTKIPTELYISLKKYYANHIYEKSIEDTSHDIDGVLKTKNQQAKLISITDKIITGIEVAVRPLLEHWCNCYLEQSGVYGIRVYTEGSVLHHHVGRVDTNAIAVLLQIDQDYQPGDDWLIELIDYQGKRQILKLFPGDMLIYEAAKMIHGQPWSFRGKSLANVLMFFTPVNGWDYQLNTEKKLFISHSKEILEPLEDLYTLLTSQKQQPVRIKDEL